jgi:hypothetical protein
MLSGSLRYGSYIEGIEFEKIEIASAEPNIQKVEVASDRDGNISIEVYVDGVANLSEAEALGQREATRVVNTLAIEQGRFVRDPGYNGHALKDDSSNAHSVGSSIGFFMHAFAPNKLGDESMAALKSALAAASPPGEADYALFRACLNTKDDASKFLALYRLLGRLADPTGRDRQPMIDALILTKEPGVAQTISPRTGAPETVYSRLRNEHMHRNVLVVQVRFEMEAHLPGLIAIVQKAIKNP